MCDKCSTTNEWKVCPYCGHELSSENKPVMTQDKFDEIFLGMLRNANTVVWHKDDWDVSDIPTCSFTLRNPGGAWMFYIRLASRNPIFMYSFNLVFKVFRDQYGLAEEDIQRLMKNQMKILFNMDGVTPRKTTFGYAALREIVLEIANEDCR